MSPRQPSDSGQTVDLTHVRVRASWSQIVAVVAVGVTLAGSFASSAWWLARELASVRSEVFALRVEIGPTVAAHGARLDALERSLAGGR